MEKMLSSDRNKIYFIEDGENVTSFCPVCQFLARDSEDLEVIQKEKACRECTTNFKYLDLESWKRGVRPSLKEARSKIQFHGGESQNE